jgi:hypothetical protein
MYCSGCGTPIAGGLSFCNRCGTSLKERGESKIGPITAFLTAIIVLGIVGLGIMLGGALSLKDGAHLSDDMVGVFMLLTFLLVGTVEVFLCRQLSRLTSGSEKRKPLAAPLQSATSNELRAAQPRSLHEPLPSVTENTTRTLQYSRSEPTRQP